MCLSIQGRLLTVLVVKPFLPVNNFCSDLGSNKATHSADAIASRYAKRVTHMF